MQKSEADDVTGKFAMTIEAVYQDRRILRTGRYLGIGLIALDKGGQLILVTGSGVQFIFRSNDDAITLVGSLYVHGTMNSEASSLESLILDFFLYNGRWRSQCLYAMSPTNLQCS